MKGQQETLKKVFARIGRYGALLALSLVLAAVTVAATLWLPILTGQAVDCIAGPGAVDFDALGSVFARMAIAIAAAAAGQWAMNLCNNAMTYRVVRDLRRAAFDKLRHMPLRGIDKRGAGEVVSRVIADADQFADGLLMGFTQLFTGVLTILGTLGFMLRLNVAITLVVVVVTPLSLGVAAFIAKSTYSMFRAQTRVRGAQTDFVNEMIEGQRVVQAFGCEDRTLARFTDLNEELRACSVRATFFSSLTNPATRFVNSLVYMGVAAAGGLAAVSGVITVGSLASFLTYANHYTKPFNEISGAATELQNAIACAARLFEIIDEEPETPDAPGALVLENARGEVDIDRLAFAYVPERPLIENFSLHVEPGMRVALVGPTGCGKTTVINLLMRFYDPDAGSISVDGADTRGITRRSLRRSYGMVLQDTWLRRGTVRENIAYGRPDATDEEVAAAARAAHAHGFIQRLPKGYDTVLSEDGGGLSQGQKQLLCIARVMLCLPPMLILDEATSSIDTRTEQRIQSAFAKMMQGRTSFIVAHRLSTIREADIILVMRDGHIVEQGRHDELLAKNGFYAELYNSQFAP